MEEVCIPEEEGEDGEKDKDKDKDKDAKLNGEPVVYCHDNNPVSDALNPNDKETYSGFVFNPRILLSENVI